VVALSTAEAEYISLAEACQEAVYLRRLLSEIGEEQKTPTTIYHDNQASMAMSKDPCFHKRSKHIDIKYHFVKDLTEQREIQAKYVPTQEMKADILTKPLTKEKFNRCIEGMMHENKEVATKDCM
jgi:hypothetical protein